MSGCPRWDATLTRWLDGELSPEEQSVVSAHLEACATCRGDLGRRRAFRAIARELPGLTSSPRARAAVMDAAERRRHPWRLRSWPVRFTWEHVVTAWAAAAALLIAGDLLGLYGDGRGPAGEGGSTPVLSYGELDARARGTALPSGEWTLSDGGP